MYSYKPRKEGHMRAPVDTVTVGAGGLRVAPLGVGAWSWGDTLFWGYGKGYDRSDVVAAFTSSINAGLTLFDTAEAYNRGASERLLGQLARSTDARVAIASKFMPYPWRLSARSLRGALDRSLQRLGVERIDLYQIHWPSPLLGTPQLMDALADAVAEGKAHYVGVSNYSAAQMRQAHAALARHGVPLVSNQVEYSLLKRTPEINGVQDACRELGVTLIAYSPLAMGLLTGKYRPGAKPSGPRRFTDRFRQQNLAATQPVIRLLEAIGAAHGGKSASQVALNWLLQRGALPIPGAKNARQATQNAGALGWALDGDQIERLDVATRDWR
jgi:aryl-alcohol dehydrogenase-like predicted oxidoreductase